jgi:biotin carboxyl carrier protein
MSDEARPGPKFHDATIACLPMVAGSARPSDAATLARILRGGFERLEVLNPCSFAILAAQGVNPWDWLRSVRRAAPGTMLSVSLSDLRGFGTARLSAIAVADVVYVMEKEAVDLFRVYLEDGGEARRDALLDAPESGAQVVPVILGAGAGGIPPPGLESWRATLMREGERCWIALTGGERASPLPRGTESSAVEFWGWTSQTKAWMPALQAAPWLLTGASVVAERLLVPDPEILALWGIPLAQGTREALAEASVALRRILKVRADAGSSPSTPRLGERIHLDGFVRSGPPVFSTAPERTGPEGRPPAEFGLMEDAALSVQMLPHHSSKLVAAPPPWAGRGVRPRPAAKSGPRARRAAEPGAEEWVTAPMPGRVVEVRVAPGQQVKAGEHLLTLEAMKMQNHIAAPRDGTVESVSVRPGDRISMGQQMVRFARPA